MANDLAVCGQAEGGGHLVCDRDAWMGGSPVEMAMALEGCITVGHADDC